VRKAGAPAPTARFGPARPRGGYHRNVTGGQVISTILLRSGVSVGDLARRLGVSEGQIAVWTRGDPPLSGVDSVARACGTDLAVVLADPDLDPDDGSVR
jgi:hypothetical protein